MSDKERNALIPLPSGGLANIGSGPKNILSGMMSDALALARVREKSLAAARFRIGDYEFRDPDYRQILIWAKALGIEPEAVINGINDYFTDDSGSGLPDHFNAALEVEDGSIVSLAWDFCYLPISSFEWVDGLRIKKVVFGGYCWPEPTKISLSLPSLNSLDCSYCRLTELDLSAVPALTGLRCGSNQLVELDLSAVPALTKLWCDGNQLVELDLSTVPALTELRCDGNKLVELDIRGLRNLKNLACDSSVILKKLPTQNF